MMINFLRKHWWDLGGLLAAATLGYLIFRWEVLTNSQRLLWVNLLALFLHQLEEYRIVGTFPAMLNRVMFRSPAPDRYPLNTNTALFVNVGTGWLVYFLAALFAEKALWLGVATMVVNLGNGFGHSLLFNIKGKTFYNAGMATGLLLFLPITVLFFYIIHTEQLASVWDYTIGLPLGAILSYIGIYKLVVWFADEETPYIFEQGKTSRE